MMSAWALSTAGFFGTLPPARSMQPIISNAARTQLFNLRTADWDDELLKLFEIPASALPQILPSSGEFAEDRKPRDF